MPALKHSTRVLAAALRPARRVRALAQEIAPMAAEEEAQQPQSATRGAPWPHSRRGVQAAADGLM